MVKENEQQYPTCRTYICIIQSTYSVMLARISLRYFWNFCLIYDRILLISKYFTFNLLVISILVSFLEGSEPQFLTTNDPLKKKFNFESRIFETKRRQTDKVKPFQFVFPYFYQVILLIACFFTHVLNVFFL